MRQRRTAKIWSLFEEVERVLQALAMDVTLTGEESELNTNNNSSRHNMSSSSTSRYQRGTYTTLQQGENEGQKISAWTPPQVTQDHTEERTTVLLPVPNNTITSKKEVIKIKKSKELLEECKSSVCSADIKEGGQYEVTGNFKNVTEDKAASITATVVHKSFNDLPDTVMLEIFSYLSQVELCRIQLVCWKWYNLSLDRDLWKTFDMTDFSDIPDDALKRFLVSKLSLKTKEIQSRNSVVAAEVIETAMQYCRNIQRLSIPNCKLSLKEKQTRKASDFQCNLKMIDMRDVKGNLNILEDYILEKGFELEVLGLCHSIGPDIRRKFYHGMPFLRILDCSECHWTTDVFIRDISRAAPALQSLSAARCINVSGSTLSELFKNCTFLQTLILQRTKISDECVRRVNWEDASITELDISHCYALDEEGIRNIIPKLTKIKYLRSAVTDNVLQDMMNVVQDLEVFELRRRYPINIDNVSILLRGCAKLKVLDVSLTPLEAKQFLEFLPYTTNLQRLYFAGHEALGTSEIIRYLGKYCRKMKHVLLNYYHANDDLNLKIALLEMTAMCPYLKSVAIQGLYVEDIISELRALSVSIPSARKVRFGYPMSFEVPPPSLSVYAAFKTYIS